MFFKNCDFISSNITLYFKGNQRHASIFSGILTIISYLSIFSFMIYYIKDFVNKKNPTIYYYNRYVEDTGPYPLNSSSIFHFLTLINTDGKPDITFDYNAIRIIGIDRSIDYYMKNYDLSRISHWVYGPCDYNETNDDKLYNIVEESIFTQSACIKQYYNRSLQKYSKIGEPGFKWPVLTYGVSNPNRTFYGIIIEKCHNDSLKNDCKSNEEINNFFKRYAIILNIVDQYADALNYKNPYTRYIYSLTSGLYPGTLSLNNLNFNPSLTKTHKGYLFDKIIDEKSYTYTQDEKITMSPEDTDIIVAFYFWMQNAMIYNERSYKKFQDLISDIGGIGSFVFLFALSINSFVTNYIILLDTEELVVNIDKVNYNKYKLMQKPPIYRKVSEMLNPPKISNYSNKNKYNSNQLQNSITPIFIKSKYDYDNNNSYSPKSEPLKSFYLNNKKKDIIQETNYINNNNFKNNYFSLLQICNNNNNIMETQRVNKSQKLELYNDNISDLQKAINRNDFNKRKKNENINKPIKKNNFTLFNYFYYLITFKRCNPKIKFYEDFRAQLISEENLLQNYSDIYKLLKACNIESHNCYEINSQH